jgi:hypothetical protein
MELHIQIKKKRKDQDGKEQESVSTFQFDPKTPEEALEIIQSLWDDYKK